MRNTILIGLVCLCFLGCSKENYSSTPSLKYKSVNIKTVSPGQIVKFTLAFTDLEGDLDSIYIQKINARCPKSGNPLHYPMGPQIEKLNSKSDDLIISFAYRVDGAVLIEEPKCDYNDTCYYQFSLLDKLKHRSDTVRSETIVIIK